MDKKVIKSIVNKVVERNLSELYEGNQLKTHPKRYILFSCDDCGNIGYRVSLFELDTLKFKIFKESLNTNIKKSSDSVIKNNDGMAQMIMDNYQRKLEKWVSKNDFAVNDDANNLCADVIKACKLLMHYDSYENKSFFIPLSVKVEIDNRFKNFLKNPENEDDVNTIINEEVIGNHINHNCYILFECKSDDENWEDYQDAKTIRGLIVRLLYNKDKIFTSMLQGK